MKHRISPASVIACVALFFSLTGAGLAAQHYLITSKSQIKPSVRAALRGERGITGPQGATGAQGIPGPRGSVSFDQIQVVHATAQLSSAQPTNGTVALCPSGDDVLNGGYTGSGEIVTQSFAKDPSEWAVEAQLQPGNTGGDVSAWAECVPAS